MKLKALWKEKAESLNLEDLSQQPVVQWPRATPPEVPPELTQLLWTVALPVL